jgi:tRNA nucleotidyltransferase (CCA-adding enzyme)
MANLHEEFLLFYKNLQIPKKKKDEMEESAQKIKKRIKEAIEMEGHKVTFREQGSSKMGTRIRTRDDKCDLDILNFPIKCTYNS